MKVEQVIETGQWSTLSIVPYKVSIESNFPSIIFAEIGRMMWKSRNIGDCSAIFLHIVVSSLIWKTASAIMVYVRSNRSISPENAKCWPPHIPSSPPRTTFFVENESYLLTSWAFSPTVACAWELHVWGRGAVNKRVLYPPLVHTYLKKTGECHLKIILHRNRKQENFMQSFFTCKSDEGNRTFMEPESITKELLLQLLKKVISGGFN